MPRAHSLGGCTLTGAPRLRLPGLGVGCGPGQDVAMGIWPYRFLITPLPPHPDLLPPPSPHPSLPNPQDLSVCVGGCWQPRPLLLPWGRGADTPQNPGLGWRGEGLLLPSLLLSQGLLGVPHLCAFTPGPLSVSLPPLGFQSRKCQGPQGVSQGRAGRGRASPHLPPPG